jgi:alpha-tubulin suppressor-like RCC1 family protein
VRATRLAVALLLASVGLAAPHAIADQSSARSPALAFASSRIDSGVAHTCAISGDGSLRCWGYNSSGELGYGNTNNVGDDETPASVGPVDLGAGRTAVETSGGSSRNCAILDNGTVRCWGNGANGALGYGNTNNIGDNETPGSAGPVDLGAGRTAVSLSTGEGFTCAILDNGTVRCWGVNNVGQLGYGNTNNIGDNETPASAGPVDLGAGRTATALSSSNGSTCAILDNGSLRCWGFGPFGILGYGNKNNIGDNETPGSVGPVDLGPGRTAVAVALGVSHACAILDTGAVKCWGQGREGELGYGNTTNIGDDETPAAVGTVDLGPGRTAVAIAAGGEHTCAILDNGSVRCWGDGSRGQLGYGNTADIGDNETPGSVGPVDLGPGRTAVAITAGQNFTCVRLDDGTVRCWGEGFFGQLGYGNTTTIGDNESPGAAGPVALGSASGALETVTGGTHTCSRFSDGSVRCWGNGASGRLGYGNTNNLGDDENVGTAGTVDLGGNAVQLAAGENHTCALLGGGSVRCWGQNGFGQLGYGNTANVGDNETPGSVSPVSLGGNAIQITAGSGHTCALLAEGNVRCWGQNSFGQLGYGNTTTIGDDESPSAAGPAALGADAVEIGAGGFHTCARLSGGTVRCWGKAVSGQLGYANTTQIGDNESPSAAGPVVLNGSTFAIGMGGEHSCAIQLETTLGRALFCWGLNSSGQLGRASTSNIGDNETPNSTVFGINLGSGNSAKAVTAGEAHTCALLTDGTVRCWGAGSDGRLGYGNTAVIGDNESPSTVGPVNLGSGLNALSIAAGGAHTCATLTTGAVRCWGQNGFGQLGYGNKNDIGDNETPAAAGPVDFVDDPPVAVDDSETLSEDVGPTAIEVLANDTDVDAGPKTVESLTQPAHGAAAITGGGTGLTYTPAANYCGSDSFTYTLNGGSTATVSITVTCVDDPPTAVADSKTVVEDTGPTVVEVLTNDTDIDGGPKSVESVTQPAHGAAAVTGGGTGLTYQPTADYCGSDSFTYELNGGSTATVSVTVTCVDDLPTAVDDSATVGEDSGVTMLDPLANDTDIDGGPKSISSVSQPGHGQVAITGGGTGLLYQPDADYCNDPPGVFFDTFAYTLNGGSTAMVSVKVTCVDDPPTAVADSDTVLENSAAQAIDVLANDTDVDGGPKSIGSKANGAHGTVAITGGGSGLTYQPEANYCGPDSFTYTLNGGSTAAVSVTVTCAPPEEKGGGGGGGTQTIIQSPGPTGPVVNVTPGVGVVSGRRHPRIAVKHAYAFFTLTCRLTERDCTGVVTISASIPSIALGPTMRKVVMVRGRFRIGSRRSVLVRAKLTKRGLKALETKQSLRGVAATMTVVDSGNGERGQIEVTLVRRPRASELGGK